MSLKNYTATQIENIRSFIAHSLYFNLKETETALFVSVDLKVSEEELLELLYVLWKNRFELSFHDPYYPPSGDDGAYFSYSTEFAPNVDIWSMTLGNQGWSGGIYHMDTITIAKQLKSLIRKSAFQRIKITENAFFSHYKLKSVAESRTKSNEILKIHESV